MASIHREIFIAVAPDQVWSAARDIGALHTRLVPGFVVDTKLEDDARIVTFGNGMVVRELIIDVDDQRRRIAWAAVGTAMTHYNASFQVFAENGGTRGVWIADLLPHEQAPHIAAMIEQGLAAMRSAMEAATSSSP
jgi:hypothetical protein